MNKFMFFMFIIFCSSSFSQTLCTGNKDLAALIVMDMQIVFVYGSENTDVPGNLARVSKVLKEQIVAINLAKKSGIPIIVIEYEGADETFEEITAAVANYPYVKFFKKTTDGLFENDNKFRKEFVDYLNQKQIGTLIIMGANGGACVRKSISGALNANCSVVAYGNGIADFNYREFIYPYTGRYDNIKPNCKNCTFT